MGGFGSGRPGGSGRGTVESCRSIDVNRLHREGCLAPGWWGGRPVKRNRGLATGRPEVQPTEANAQKENGNQAPLAAGTARRRGAKEPYKTSHSGGHRPLGFRRRPHRREAGVRLGLQRLSEYAELRGPTLSGRPGEGHSAPPAQRDPAVVPDSPRSQAVVTCHGPAPTALP